MKKALIVGINNYKNSPLEGCVNDATQIAELLTTDGNGDPNFEVKQKNNVQTKAELLKDLNDLFCKGKADVALFYFSGHGSQSFGGSIVTPDYNGLDMGISMAEILRMANTSKSENKVIIMDCCFSGTMGDLTASCSNEALVGPGVTILTACDREEVSFEDSKTKHGVFTSLLIEGLKGGAADLAGNITAANLYTYVDQSLGAWEQRPLFKTNISKSLAIRKVEPKVSKRVLRKICQYFDSPDALYELNPSFEETNYPEAEHTLIVPYAEKENVKKFKELQLLESIGIVEPVGEQHMYFAAMNNKGCRLTSIGQHYWKLSKDKRF